MIDELDTTLHELLINDVPALSPNPPAPLASDQVAFRAPDDSWRLYVDNGLKRKALNVYLVDVHENAKLRSNERARVYDDGIVADVPAPARLDCHYLITAWSPAAVTAGRAGDEHQLLYQAARALLGRRPLVPAAIWGGSLPATFVALTDDMQLPMTVAPPEGYAHFSYFWSGMGADPRWKPAFSLIVTLPVLMARREYGPPVTTATAQAGISGGGGIDLLVAIGGRVLDRHGTPVPGARVAVALGGGREIDATETDADGRFRLGGLGSGAHTLRARAIGLGFLEHHVDIPSPTGEYELQFA